VPELDPSEQKQCHRILLHCEIETSTDQGGTGVDLADASRRIHPASHRRSELTYCTS
jgi:hypothetical protein